MTATIGICLATCNGARFLQTQLDSIAGQSFTDWHLYARDDASDDESARLLHAFAARFPRQVTVVEDTDGRLGATANFARLMQLTREPYIAFSDQDDLWRPWKLAVLMGRMRAVEPLRGADTPCLVHGDRRVVDSAGRLLARSYWASRDIDAGASDFGKSLAFCLAAGAAMLVNRALVQQAVPMPAEARMYDTWLELVAHAFGTVSAIDEVLLDWRRHEANTSGSATDNNSPATRRLWSRGVRLLRDPGRQRAIYAGYVDQARMFQALYGPRLAAAEAHQIDRFIALPRLGGLARLQVARQFGIAPPGVGRQLVFAMLSGRRPVKRKASRAVRRTVQP